MPMCIRTHRGPWIRRRKHCTAALYVLEEVLHDGRIHHEWCRYQCLDGFQDRPSTSDHFDDWYKKARFPFSVQICSTYSGGTSDRPALPHRGLTHATALLAVTYTSENMHLSSSKCQLFQPYFVSKTKSILPSCCSCQTMDGLFFFFCCSSPAYYLRTLSIFVSLPRSSPDPGSLRRLVSPLPTTARVFFGARELSALSSLADSRQIVLTHETKRSRRAVSLENMISVPRFEPPHYILSSVRG